MFSVRLMLLAFGIALLSPAAMESNTTVSQSSKLTQMTIGETNPIATSQPIAWDDTATGLRSRLDQDFSLTCPASGRIGSVWGTDIYTDDSSICSAAVHAGLISTHDGGKVTIRIRPGEDSYAGTNRNGFRSSSYGSWSRSFVFLNTVGNPIEPIEWGDTATGLRGRLDQDFSVNCPPSGHVGSVWGTDIYTDDSSICSAAVHAGLISASDGGKVTIRIRPGEGSYAGTDRNGVRSNSYGRWRGSFTFPR